MCLRQGKVLAPLIPIKTLLSLKFISPANTFLVLAWCPLYITLLLFALIQHAPMVNVLVVFRQKEKNYQINQHDGPEKRKLRRLGADELDLCDKDDHEVANGHREQPAGLKHGFHAARRLGEWEFQPRDWEHYLGGSHHYDLRQLPEHGHRRDRHNLQHVVFLQK